MRLLPNIRFGTERYPEKVARRLRAVNVAAWLAVIVPFCFLFVRSLEGRWLLAVENAFSAAAFASVPLLHRFGQAVAPTVLSILVYIHIFRVVALNGTGDGAWLTYLTATALAFLLLGIENILFAAALAATAAMLMIVVHIIFPHNSGLAPDDALFYGHFVVNVVMNVTVLFTVMFYAVRQLNRAEDAAEREHQRSERLLVNILPEKVAARLKERPDEVIADSFSEASILFADMEGFTARATDLPPAELVSFLNLVFTRLDGIVDRHGLEKIKTTGDAYMVVSGLPEPRADHAEALADLAINMRDALAGLVDPKGRPVAMRIGLASGPVVAGVVGTRKFYYDVWGDAVNTASRMESTGEVGKIQVSAETRALLGVRFEFEDRGLIEVRGKGGMHTWFLLGRCAVATAE
jgi:adenylate cyclase